jgi:succinate dehydrogenase / fumarate reductase membrane anchor subunit
MSVRKKGLSLWLLQRLSGIYLIFGMIVHFWLLHFSGEEQIGFHKVTERLKEPCWVVFDASLLITVLYHALVGAYRIICDFGIKESAQKTLAWILTIIGFFLGIIGIWILIAFTR